MAAESANGREKQLEVEVGLLRDAYFQLEQAQKEVQKEKEFSQEVIDSLPGALFMMNHDRQIVFWNKALEQVGGHTGEQVRTMRPADLFEERDRSRLEVAMQQAFKEGTASGEARLLQKDGEGVPLLYTAVRVMRGHDPFVICVGVDISERKKAETRVKELNTLRRKFIRIVSHQLRTPLSVTRFSLDALLTGEAGKLSEGQRELAEMAQGANVTVISRINDLLVVLDIQEGRVLLDKVENSLESLWLSVMGDSKSKAQAKGVELVYTKPTKPLSLIEIDGEKMRDVFVKLLNNALVYTPGKGKVTAVFKQEDGMIRFELNDTGIGVPEPEQARIFNRFFRASNASTVHTDASGISLSIVKYFVEQHGGTVGFTSKEGEGSTFWFTLPL